MGNTNSNDSSLFTSNQVQTFFDVEILIFRKDLQFYAQQMPSKHKYSNNTS